MNSRGEGRRPFVSGVVALMIAVVTPCLQTVASGQDDRRASGGQAPGGNWLLELGDHRGEDVGEGNALWGYSVLIRYRGQSILFDGGVSATVLEHNARVYGVDLSGVDLAVLSHSHGDHSAGLDHLFAVNPSVRLYVPSDRTLGADWPEEKQSRPGYRYPTDNMVFVDASTEVAEGVHLVATTSPYTGYFSRYPPNEDEPKLYNLPELSLALETDSGGVVLIVGCSHSGVDSIVKETRRSTGADTALLTGGFHLGLFSAEHVSRLARSLKEDLHVRRVAPTHCTGDDAIAAFRELYGEGFVQTGLGTRIALPR